jgi:hypothetical protein
MVEGLERPTPTVGAPQIAAGLLGVARRLLGRAYVLLRASTGPSTYPRAFRAPVMSRAETTSAPKGLDATRSRPAEGLDPAVRFEPVSAARPARN